MFIAMFILALILLISWILGIILEEDGIVALGTISALALAVLAIVNFGLA